ncbi:MAG: TolC family protein [Planctomycetaceae bacterium]
MKRYSWTDWCRRLLTVAVAVTGAVAARPALTQEWSGSNTARPVTVPEQWPHSPTARGNSRTSGGQQFPSAARQPLPNDPPPNFSRPNVSQPANPNLPVITPRQNNLRSPFQSTQGTVSNGAFSAPVPPRPPANGTASTPRFSGDIVQTGGLMPTEPSGTVLAAGRAQIQPPAASAVPNTAITGGSAPRELSGTALAAGRAQTQPPSNQVQWAEFPPNPGQFSNLPRTSSDQGSSPPSVMRTSAEQEAAIVVNAFSEVTPRSRVTANTAREPPSKPLSKIRQVSSESCPNQENAGAIPAESLIAPFAQRAQSYPTKNPLPIQAGQLIELPKDFVPWWDEVINRPLRADIQNLNVDAESLVLKAIEHSPQIIAMRIDPVVREIVILEENADFDWVSFLDTTYNDTSDPIGSTLTAGMGKTRYRDNHVQSKAGFRKKLDSGGKFDISQRFGYQDTNSNFFIPANQGTSRIELNFTQPLLRGGGETVSQSRIVLASLDYEMASADLLDNMQDHLVAVYESYWNLYRARANRLQKTRLLQRAIKTQKMLEDRQGVDSIRRQILRAQSAVASRRAEIVRSETAIRNAESRLRLLVNSPDLKDRAQIELLPSELPLSEELEVTLRGSVESALTHRPDIFSAIQRMKAESLRLEVAKNDLLPKLDLALGTYITGLRGNGQIDKAWNDQFNKGEPGYNIGLSFEMPLGNRAAKARECRRQWELAKSLKEFEASVETAMTEVEIAVRETETAYQEMLGHFQAMIASENEAQYLEERWKLIPGNDQTISFVLEDLLDAQERVANEEADYVASQVAYVMSVVHLKRATGILLTVDQSGAAQVAPAQNPKQLMQPVPQPTYLPPAPGPLRLPNP